MMERFACFGEGLPLREGRACCNPRSINWEPAPRPAKISESLAAIS